MTLHDKLTPETNESVDRMIADAADKEIVGDWWKAELLHSNKLHNHLMTAHDCHSPFMHIAQIREGIPRTMRIMHPNPPKQEAGWSDHAHTEKGYEIGTEILEFHRGRVVTWQTIAAFVMGIVAGILGVQVV